MKNIDLNSVALNYYKDQLNKGKIDLSSENNSTIRKKEKMKFSDLDDKQKNEFFILDPEWLAYNRPEWMIENHLYRMLTNYPHIIDDLKSGATVDNRYDYAVHIPDHIADKILFKPTEEREYQKYEFCKAMHCRNLKFTDAGKPVCNALCSFTARNFHHWLKKNGFIIKKKL